jgi:HAMP domain-containing protein
MAATQERPRLSIPPVWDIRAWRMGPKLLGAFLAAVVLPLALSGFLSIRWSRDALLAQGTINLTTKSNSTSNAIDQYLGANREDIVAISSSAPIAAFMAEPNDATVKANALKELQAMANRQFYESIATINSEGIIILSSAEADMNTNVKARDFFIEGMKGAAYISNPFVSVETGLPAIFFSAPITGQGGKIVGVVVSRLGPYGIWDLVEKDTDSVGQGTFGVLLDENGIRIAHGSSEANRFEAQQTLLYTAVAPLPDATAKQLVAEKRFGKATEDKVAVLPLPEVAAALAHPEISSFESSAEGTTVRHYAAISPLRFKPWHYVVMTPLPTFTGAADALAFQFVVLTILVAAITGVVVVFYTRTFTQPIVQLTQVAERISLGELDAKIAINRKDEIGDLAEAIGRMQASLQAAIERLRARRAAR